MLNRYASLRQGLVGCWVPSLGASGFRLIDRSGNNNHGVLTGMDPGTDWFPSGGKLALDFDGVNDYVISGLNQTAEILNSNVFSFCLWGYVRSFSNSPVLLAVGTNSTPAKDSVLIETNNTGSQLYIKSANNTEGLTGARTYTLTNSLVANQWFHIAFLKTGAGDNGTIYVNGVAQTSFTGTLGTCVSVASNSLVLAAYTNFVAPLNGQLDDIRIYNRALTPSEIRLLYTGGRGVGLLPERIKHRRKTSAAAFNRRRRILIGASQ